jgi:hypothetical protein
MCGVKRLEAGCVAQIRSTAAQCCIERHVVHPCQMAASTAGTCAALKTAVETNDEMMRAPAGVAGLELE